MKIGKNEREKIRMMFGGRCAYCGYELPEKGWHADHVKAVLYDTEFIRGGYDEHGMYTPSRLKRTGRVLRPENDTKENIFPACRPCNIDKGSESLDEWRLYLQDKMIDVMRRDIPNFRHAERFGRVTINPEPLVFWFEKYAKRDSENGKARGSNSIRCGSDRKWR